MPLHSTQQSRSNPKNPQNGYVRKKGNKHVVCTKSKWFGLGLLWLNRQRSSSTKFQWIRSKRKSEGTRSLSDLKEKMSYKAIKSWNLGKACDQTLTLNFISSNLEQVKVMLRCRHACGGGLVKRRPWKLIKIKDSRNFRLSCLYHTFKNQLPEKCFKYLDVYWTFSTWKSHSHCKY